MHIGAGVCFISIRKKSTVIGHLNGKIQPGLSTNKTETCKVAPPFTVALGKVGCDDLEEGRASVLSWDRKHFRGKEFSRGLTRLVSAKDSAYQINAAFFFPSVIESKYLYLQSTSSRTYPMCIQIIRRIVAKE